MKKVKSNNARKEIQIIAGLVVITILGLIVWSYVQNMDRLVANDGSNQIQVDPTSDWKTLTNDKMKISFKYPTNWELNKLGESKSFQQYILTYVNDSNSVTVNISPEKCQSNPNCLEIPKYPKFKSLTMFEADNVDDYKAFEIDGVDAISYIYNDFPIGTATSDQKIFSFLNNGITYNITYYEQKDDLYLNRVDWKYLSVVNNIISSIKLK